MKIHTPPMTFKQGEGDNDGKAIWDKQYAANHDDIYGNGILRFASEWATRMEAALAADPAKKVEDVAEQCSREADNEGITGFMYGAAVQVLSWCWVHGEKLRRWHNKDIQIGDEGDKANESGGVLNPAILNIG